MEVLYRGEVSGWRVLHLPESRVEGTHSGFVGDGPAVVAKGCMCPCPAGNGSHMLVGRFHADRPSEVEFQEICTEELPGHSVNLRLRFPHPLAPSMCMVPPQGSPTVRSSSGAVFLLTEAGQLYSLALGSSSGAQKSALAWLLHTQAGDIQECGAGPQLGRLGAVSCMAAGPTWLCVGGQSGAVSCFPLRGAAPGNEAAFDLREGDAVMQRLWGMVTRARGTGPVQALAVRTLRGEAAQQVLVAGHADGHLRCWHLARRQLLLSLALPVPPDMPHSGFPLQRWAVEEVPDNAPMLHVGLIYRDGEEAVLSVHRLTIERTEEGLSLLPPALPATCRPLPQGAVVDAVLQGGSAWVLLAPASPGPSSLDPPQQPLLWRAPLGPSVQLPVQCRLWEQQMASALLLEGGTAWQHDAMFADQCLGDAAFGGVGVGELVLQRMLTPGVASLPELRRVLQQRGRAIAETADLKGLPRELRAAAEQGGGEEEEEEMGVSEAAQEVQRWRRLSVDYLQTWQEAWQPGGLLADAATGAVGVLRRKGASLIREPDDVEQLPQPLSKQQKPAALADPVGAHCAAAGAGSAEAGAGGPSAASSVAAALQACTALVRQQLGPLALAAMESALVHPRSGAAAAVLPPLVRVLEAGLCAGARPRSVRAQQAQQEQHRRQRLRSLHLLAAVESLRRQGGGWKGALEALSAALDAAQWAPTPTSMPSRGGAGSSHAGSTAVRQTEEARFQAARDLLLLLAYLAHRRSQLGLGPKECARVQLQLLPRALDLLATTRLLHWLACTPPQPTPEDFTLQLSSLGIDGDEGQAPGGPWAQRAERTLAQALLPPQPKEAPLVSPVALLQRARQSASWLRWGAPPAAPSHSPAAALPSFPQRAVPLALQLLELSQFDHLQLFLLNVERVADTQRRFQPGDGGVPQADLRQADGARAFLLGFASLACAQAHAADGSPPADRSHLLAQAVSCFFRAAAGVGEDYTALGALVDLFTPGAAYSVEDAATRTAASRLRYFEAVMAVFERYGCGEAAGQFAHAALEQVDAALLVPGMEGSAERAAAAEATRGRLWANICKFALEGERYPEAFCALVSTPHKESQRSCLRHLVGVLCERGALQVLCEQALPYGGLESQVEEELMWKAEHSDVDAEPSPYRLLYAFHMQRGNWRRAAQAMYRLAQRGAQEGRGLEALRRREESLAAALTALQLLPAPSAWLPPHASLPSPQPGTSHLPSPTKRRRFSAPTSTAPAEHRGEAGMESRPVVSLADVERERAVAAALLQLAACHPHQPVPSAELQEEQVVRLLTRAGLYDTALQLIGLCWTGSVLSRHLEAAFEAMARACCTLQLEEEAGSGTPLPDLRSAEASSRPGGASSPWSSAQASRSARDAPPSPTHAAPDWHHLRRCLERHWGTHPRLREVVAATILAADARLQLPHWLLALFQTREGGDDLGGDSAALIQIYLNAGLVEEAALVALQQLHRISRQKLAEPQRRKQLGDRWIPYSLVDRLRMMLAQVPEGSESERLRSLGTALERALEAHLAQVKVDSEDFKLLSATSNSQYP